MTLPFSPPLEPMLAKASTEIPEGAGWRYEPKWDGFRAIVFRDGGSVRICSRNGLPLERYFPELADPLREALPEGAIVDGEVVIATDHGLDFDSLQLRLHPAESRVRRLAQETPSSIVLFDLLADGDTDLRGAPLDERRARLTAAVVRNETVGVTPHTADLPEATTWFTQYEGAGLDGVVAKQATGTYRPGERGWVKVKHLRTVDAVVGGYRPLAKGEGVGSLLLGLYDGDGVLHHVGHTSSFNAAQRRQILAQLQPIVGGESFGHGRTPGAPSRWNNAADSNWTSVEPRLVCEVSFDHLQGRRFRHAARFLRWREDKSPSQCTFDQLAPPEAFALSDILIR